MCPVQLVLVPQGLLKLSVDLDSSAVCYRHTKTIFIGFTHSREEFSIWVIQFNLFSIWRKHYNANFLLPWYIA